MKPAIFVFALLLPFGAPANALGVSLDFPRIAFPEPSPMITSQACGTPVSISGACVSAGN